MELAERVAKLEKCFDGLTGKRVPYDFPFVDFYDPNLASCRDLMEAKAEKALASSRMPKDLADRILILEKRLWFLEWQIQMRR